MLSPFHGQHKSIWDPFDVDWSYTYWRFQQTTKLRDSNYFWLEDICILLQNLCECLFVIQAEEKSYFPHKWSSLIRYHEGNKKKNNIYTFGKNQSILFDNKG